MKITVQCHNLITDRQWTAKHHEMIMSASHRRCTEGLWRW